MMMQNFSEQVQHAKGLLKNHQYEEAYDLASSLLTKARDYEDRIVLIQVIANALTFWGRYDEANRHRESLIKIAEQTSAPVLKIEALGGIAFTHNRAKNFPSAIDTYLEIEEECADHLTDVFRGKINLGMAVAYRGAEQHQKALECSEKAQVAFQCCLEHCQDPRARENLEKKLNDARVTYFQGLYRLNSSRAIRVITEMLSEFKCDSDWQRKHRAAAYESRGRAFSKLGRHDEALHDFQDAIALLENLDQHRDYLLRIQRYQIFVRISMGAESDETRKYIEAQREHIESLRTSERDVGKISRLENLVDGLTILASGLESTPSIEELDILLTKLNEIGCETELTILLLRMKAYIAVWRQRLTIARGAIESALRRSERISDREQRVFLGIDILRLASYSGASNLANSVLTFGDWLKELKPFDESLLETIESELSLMVDSNQGTSAKKHCLLSFLDEHFNAASDD